MRARGQRSLAAAAVVTLLGVALTAVPPTLVPASDSPPQIPRAYSVGLTWLGAHRPAFALLAVVALALGSALGYALTCLAVRLLRRRGTATDWHGLLIGLGWTNSLSVLSALVPLPGVVMQILHIPGYIPVDVVLIPPAVALGGWVAVPAWWTLRDAGGLSPVGAVLAFAVPVAVVIAVGVVSVVAGFQLAWGNA